ncbi:MAG: hypothetical protein WBC70_13775 [Candidatus Aminicenantales bacterium]
MLNNLLAAPGFTSWLEGDPLDIDTLLYTPAGKPRLSILSIAHLTDAERMFFVTLFLNQLLGWMRRRLTAQQRLEREQEQYKGQMTHTAISVGATILGSILGRKSAQVGRATTSARSASRAYYEKMDIQRARQQLEAAQERLTDLQKQVEEETARITDALNPDAEVLQPLTLRPKKKDIMAVWSGLLWLPYWHRDDGGMEPGFRKV